MNKQRPVFLNVMQIRLPVPALASILHRLSGIVIFFALPFLLWGLSHSLVSKAGYKSMQTCMSHVSTKIALWVLLSALIYHVIAGLRHLIMDMGFGESLRAGRVTAFMTIILAFIFSILAGVWLW